MESKCLKPNQLQTLAQPLKHTKVTRHPSHASEILLSSE